MCWKRTLNGTLAYTVFYRLSTVIDRSFPVRPSFFHGELISYFLKSLPKWVTGYFYRGGSVSSVLRRKFYLPRRYTKILGQPLSDAPPRSNDFLGQFPAGEKIMSTISAELREPRTSFLICIRHAGTIKLIIVQEYPAYIQIYIHICIYISSNVSGVSWPDEISLGFTQSDYSLIKYLHLMTLDLCMLHIISARIIFQFNRSIYVLYIPVQRNYLFCKYDLLIRYAT